MKNRLIAFAACAAAALSPALQAKADDLVLLTTNDTHSNIDFERGGRGGILPRKAIVDSVRAAEKNVMLIDAGDFVQGSLYFKYFRGDVEYPLMNMMGYDIRVLGNHEFDNGLDELAAHWKDVKGKRLSANYDFKDTPAKGLFDPYMIKKVGNKKIGFIGINVNPESLIIKENYAGMKYEDAIAVANRTAEFLKKKKGCDLVVAVTHIGYTATPGKASDLELARQSKDIDIIIGGHSHTVVDPGKKNGLEYWVDNANGKPVLVTQTGKNGSNIGYIKIDLDDLKDHDYEYRYIPVTDRFPAEKYDKKMIAFLEPYKAKVDSVNKHVIGYSLIDMVNNDRTGAYANFTADMGREMAQAVADSMQRAGQEFPNIDMSFMNVGGIRQNMKKGAITEGQMLSTFPFSNRLVIVQLKGQDIIDALKVAATKGGESISGNLRVLTDGNGNLLDVYIDGKKMDPAKTYTVATIDYVAQGNDDLVTMANNRMLWADKEELSRPILRYIKELTAKGFPVNPDTSKRFVKKI